MLTEEERRERSNGQERVCVVCGARFKGNGVARYCSPECRKRAASERAKGWYKENKGGDERVCPVCGKAFRALTKRRMYCSERCKSKAKDDRKREERERSKGETAFLLRGMSKERAREIEGMEDGISRINEIGREKHKSYGEIRTEMLLKKMEDERERQRILS